MPETTTRNWLPHQVRVLDELAELNVKLNKLTAFIAGDSPTWLNLPDDEKFRLRLQSLSMRSYAAILQERIEHFAVE